MPDAYELYCRHAPRVYDTPTPEMELVGARFRLGRQRAGLSQRALARRAGVSQSLVSRFERGRAPGMSARRVIAIALAIGRAFPFGFCPHDHKCGWPYKPPANRPWFEILNSRP